MALFPSSQDILNKIGTPETAGPLPSSTDILSKVRSQAAQNASALVSSGNKFGEFIGGALKSAATGIYNYGKTVVDTVAQASKDHIIVSPLDAAQGTLDTIVNLAKGINIGAVRVAKSATEAVGITPAPSPLGNAFIRTITGEEKPVPTYQDIYTQKSTEATTAGATPSQAALYGGAFVLGTAFLDDPIGFGGIEKAGIKLSEDAMKRIAATTDAYEIARIVSNENPGITKKGADAVSTLLTQANTPAEVRAVTERITAQTAPGAPKTTEPLPTSEEVLARSQGTPIDITNATRPEIKAITNELKSRTISFDELPDHAKGALQSEIRAQITNEGAPTSLAKDMLQTRWVENTKNISDLQKTNSGIFADTFTKRGSMSNGPILINEKGIVIDGNNRLREAFDRGEKTITAYEPAPYEQLNKGAGAPIPYNEVVAAQKKIPFSTNLVRTIADLKMTGPIADVLSGRFINLSRPTLEKFAERLRSVSNEAQIHSTLTFAKRVDDEMTRILAEGKTAAGRTTIRKAMAGEESAATARANKLEQDIPGMPAAVGEVMSPEDIARYLHSVKDEAATADSAVLAQAEYDLMWEHLGGTVITRLSDAELERSFLRDAMQDNPAGELYNTYYRALGRDVGDPTFALEDVMHRASAKAKQIAQTGRWRVDGKTGTTLSKYEQSARSLDTHIEALGYKDFEEAQAAVENYVQNFLKKEQTLTDEIRILRPQARQAKILSAFLESVPVVSREKAGEIFQLATRDRVLYDYTDISGLNRRRRDITRNFREFFGTYFEQARKVFLAPLDDGKRAFILRIQQLAEEMKTNVAGKYNFARGSKESAAIQDWGERFINDQPVPGRNFEYITEEGLVKHFGREKADQIMESADWFHKQYIQRITRANEVIRKIYPNDASKLIQERKDYFRHFQELGNGFKDLVDVLFERGPLGAGAGGIPPELSGLSEFTKPRMGFKSFIQERVSQRSERDAIGGYLDYINQFAYLENIDPHIANFRYLRRALDQAALKPGTLTETGRTKGINNFLGYLDDFGNSLAKKTNPLDRWLQDTVPGGRKTMKTLTWGTQRVSANTIGMNMSSGYSQIFNLPQVLAESRGYWTAGLRRTLAELLKKNELVKNDPGDFFITERYADDIRNSFKFQWTDHPLKRGTAEAKQYSKWILQAGDQIVALFGRNALFEKARALGIPEPVRYANEHLRELIAGRGIGELPQILESRVGRLSLPFQVEVNNLWDVMGDQIGKHEWDIQTPGAFGKRDFVGLVILLLANNLLNDTAEKVTGHRVVYDPINALMDGLRQADEEMQAGNPGRAAVKLFGRQAGEALSNVLGGQVLSAAFPSTSLPYGMNTNEFFGRSNPQRFGVNPFLLMTSWDDPLYRLLPPLGGGQAKKTIEAIGALMAGRAKDSKGNYAFSIDPKPLTVAQAVLFGKNATPEAQAYYATRDDLFQRIYRQDWSRSDLQMRAEVEYQNVKDLIKSGDKKGAADRMKELMKNDIALAEAVGNVFKDEAAGLDGVDRLVKMLGVENGERAKYVIDQAKQMGTRKEQIDFLSHLAEKNLLSSQLIEQLKIMLPPVLKPK